VLSCVGRGLDAGLIPPPKKSYQMSNGSISKKEKSESEKGIRKMTKKKNYYLRAEFMFNGNMIFIPTVLGKIPKWQIPPVASFV
jgi:hypothetical protein